VISGESQTVAGRADQFAGAYKALRADSSVQFNLAPPTPRPKPPGWLEALLNWLDHHLFTPIGKALSWIGSFFPDAAYARILLWIVIAAGAAILAWALFNRVRHGEWSLRIPRRAAPGELPQEEEWAPEWTGARAWLEEADALAREGRFAAAFCAGGCSEVSKSTYRFSAGVVNFRKCADEDRPKRCRCRAIDAGRSRQRQRSGFQSIQHCR